jgi:two-component system sensor histidine kinase QseC
LKTTTHPSLQSQLTVLVLSAVMVIWLLTSFLAWQDASHEVDEILDSHLAQAASLLVVQQATEMGENEHQVDAPLLHHYAPKVLFQVFHEGQLSMRSANAPSKPLHELKGLQNGFSTIQLDNVSWRVFAAYGNENDVQVFVAEKIETRAAILKAVVRSMSLPLLLALPLLGIAVWWAIRRGIRPLNNLGKLLAKRQAGSLDEIYIEASTSEMQPMIASLNDLLKRTANLLESEQRFTADAAHELRTPIAAIRMQAQVALAELNQEQQKRALINTLAGCDRATHLVEQLLTLARLESAEQTQKESIDLGALVRSVMGEIAIKALSKNQNLVFELDEAAPATQARILGNPILLAILLRNLIDNAIRYSPDSAKIIVHQQVQDKQNLLLIEDSGPGLSDAEMQRLGERFFRVIGNQASGSGLGWSIIRRIAQAHQIEIAIEKSSKLGGLSISLKFVASE